MLSSMTLAKFVIRIAVSAYKGVKDILRIIELELRIELDVEWDHYTYHNNV